MVVNPSAGGIPAADPQHDQGSAPSQGDPGGRGVWDVLVELPVGDQSNQSEGVSFQDIDRRDVWRSHTSQWSEPTLIQISLHLFFHH